MSAASQQIDRFVAYLNEASLPLIPRTAIVYRSDGSPIVATEIPLDVEVLRLLDAKESSDYGVMTIGELIQRKHGSASLVAHQIELTPRVRQILSPTLTLTGVPDGEILAINYESLTEAELRVYPITRDAGAMRFSTFVSTPNPPRYFKKYYV